MFHVFQWNVDVEEWRVSISDRLLWMFIVQSIYKKNRKTGCCVLYTNLDN